MSMCSISNNNDNSEQLDKGILTLREEQGFLFEGEVSELLFSIGIDHDEYPHLFREEFKQNITVRKKEGRWLFSGLVF